MKKIISILFMVAFVASATFGQYGKATTEPVLAGDTVTNGIAFTKVISASAGYNSITFQPVVTRASGKVYGWIKLYGSLNGVDYNVGKQGSSVALDSAKIILPSTGHKAPILGANITGALYCYYKLVLTNDSTGKGTIVVWDLFRKQAASISTP